jgi:hypothetical protein
MKFITIIILTTSVFFVSCKKERTCVCQNSSATYDAGTVDATKSQAKKYCKTLSVGQTNCKLKE